MKVVILCGGEGIRLKHHQYFLPKALVKIDDKPILWHIMKKYSIFGHNEFILALGKFGNLIRDYFINYKLYTNDLGLTLGAQNSITYYNQSQEEDWKITFVNTGEYAHTGARLNRCKAYLSGEEFMLTYADCLSDVNLDSLVMNHHKAKKAITVTGVLPPFRYGEFIFDKNKVVGYESISKLEASRGCVNGGYMILNKNIFNYLNSYNECTLEDEVFKEMVKRNDLNIYLHDGFWQCLDNDREYEYLKKLGEENRRFWLKIAKEGNKTHTYKV